MIVPVLQRRKVSLRETAVWSRPGFGLADQGAGSSGRQERQPVGTASPAWPGLGKSRDRRPVARQQARNGVGGGGSRRRKGNRLWTLPAVDHRPSCEGASGEVRGAGRAGESPHRALAFSAHPPTPRALLGFGPRCPPLGLVLGVGVRRRSRASLTPQPKGSAPRWKVRRSQCGSRGKSPSVGPVPWPTSHIRPASAGRKPRGPSMWRCRQSEESHGGRAAGATAPS